MNNLQQVSALHPAVKFMEMFVKNKHSLISTFSSALKIQTCQLSPKHRLDNQPRSGPLPTAGSICETKGPERPLSTKFLVSSLSSTYYSDRTCSWEIQRVHVRHMQITLSESYGFGNSVSLGCFNYRLGENDRGKWFEYATRKIPLFTTERARILCI